jgi:sodium transport system permease protein
VKHLEMARRVAKKELTDHARDRRSVTSALLLPLFGPLLIAVLFTLMARWNRTDKVTDLPVVGRDAAPNLIAYLERSGIKTREAPADYEAEVQDGALDVVLVVPSGYPKAWRNARPAEVRLVLDSSRASARGGQERVRRALAQYGSLVGAERLIARGVSPELLRPLDVEDKDLATPEKQAAMVLNFIPLFLVLAAFMGGLNIAIDVTAGERERGSLEPLLLNPVARLAVVLGKWAATIVGSLAATAVSLAAFYLIVHRVPLHELGVKARFEALEIARVMLALLPLLPLAAALEMLVATYARSFKEAQTYTQLLMMAPMVPGMLLSLSPMKPEAWMMIVPVFGQDVMLTEVMRGEAVPALWYALGAFGALGLAALAIAVTTRLFGKEAIVFGR